MIYNSKLQMVYKYDKKPSYNSIFETCNWLRAFVVSCYI